MSYRAPGWASSHLYFSMGKNLRACPGGLFHISDASLFKGAVERSVKRRLKSQDPLADPELRG